MRRFDVYANPSNATRKAYPYIVDIQSDTISALATRIVVPPGRKVDLKGRPLAWLTPEVTHKGQELLLLLPQIATLPVKVLKNPVGSLSHSRGEIVAALDFAVAGI